MFTFSSLAANIKEQNGRPGGWFGIRSTVTEDLDDPETSRSPFKHQRVPTLETEGSEGLATELLTARRPLMTHSFSDSLNASAL